MIQPYEMMSTLVNLKEMISTKTFPTKRCLFLRQNLRIIVTNLSSDINLAFS